MPDKVPSCQHAAIMDAYHQCPYQYDVNGVEDPEYCNCCNECTQQCADDI